MQSCNGWVAQEMKWLRIPVSRWDIQWLLMKVQNHYRNTWDARIFRDSDKLSRGTPTARRALLTRYTAKSATTISENTATIVITKYMPALKPVVHRWHSLAAPRP